MGYFHLRIIDTFRHRDAQSSKVRKGWGALGILASVGALALNLQTFPVPPSEAGLVDLGPAVALWMLAASIRFLAITDP